MQKKTTHGKTEKRILENYIEAKLLVEDKKYNKANSILNDILLSQDVKSNLPIEQYIDYLMLFRKVNFLEKKYDTARLLEEEIIDSLFGKKIQPEDYLTIDPQASPKPLLTELTLSEMIGTYIAKNIFYTASLENNKKPKEADLSLAKKPYKQTYGLSEKEYHKKFSKESRKNKPKNYTLRNAVVIILLLLSVYVYPTVSDGATVVWNNIYASDSIKEIANNSGFNLHGKALFYQTNPELVTADQLHHSCPSANESAIEFGCYIPKGNKIYILAVGDPDLKGIQYTTAAHETLHSIFVKLNKADRQNIVDLLRAIYNDTTSTSSKLLHEKLKLYENESSVIDNELHSFFGSEVRSSGNTVAIEEYYRKYFDDRVISIIASEHFESSIKAKTNALELRRISLNSTSIDLNNYKHQYLDSIEAAMQANSYYGDINTYNINVGIYNKNLVIYKDKVSKLNADIDKFNSDVEEFNKVLKTFYPTKAPIQPK